MLFAPVEEVRLYQNSAVVRRRAEISLQAGTNEVILSGLSGTADPDSLRLFFSADVVGTDLQLLPMEEVTDRLPSRELEQEIQDLKTRIQTLETMEKLWFSNGNFTQRGDWAKENIESYLEGLPARVGNLRSEKQRLEQQVAALLKQLEEQQKKEAFLAVRLVLSSPDSCRTAVELEYSERSAMWIPAYEVHTSAESSELLVVSRARMLQNTPEDWENVRVSLYTGNPTARQAIPVLNKLSLRFMEDHSASAYPPRTSVSYAREMALPMGAAPSKAEPAPTKRMAMEEVVTADTETMTEYVLSGRRTVVSGTVGTMADLKTDRIPAEKRVICVPKLDNSAYLAAAVKTAEWPLKPAKAKIYLDQNYCGEVYAAPDHAEEEFLLSLGRDEHIAVRRETVRVRTENVLLKGQKRKLSEFSIQVSNLSEQTRTVTVWDQIPVSTEKQIVVDQVETAGAKLDSETGKLHWDLKVEGKQTVEKRFSYAVSYPKDKQLQEIQTQSILRAPYEHPDMGKPRSPFCPNCGAPANGRVFCNRCGTKL